MKAQGLYVSPTQFVSFAEGQKPQRLSDHIATRDRSPNFTALGMYLPNPDPILKKQGRDIAIYSDLRGDAHVGGCIRRRKAGVLKMEWRINRDKASARTAKLCETVLGQLDMRRLLREVLDAPLFGWQPLEIIWSPSNAGPIIPMDVLAKPVQWFHYDAEAQLRFKSRQAPLYGEPTAARKFLVPAQDASYANPYGFADLSMCFWPTVFKRGGLKFWVTFTEKYGTPWLVGKTPRGTPPKEQDALLDQLEAMVQDAVAVIPDDSSVDIVESAGKTASADLYERLLMFCRSEISIALLGQNQTTEASANRASATAGLEVTDDLRDADARLAEAAINQLLRWIVDLNEGEAASAPKFELYEQEEVNTVQAERDNKLTQAGAKFTPQYFKRVYDLEDGDLDETPTPPPGNLALAGQKNTLINVQPGVKPADNAAFAEPTATPEPDALDAVIDAEMAEWESLLEPMTGPLQAAIDAAVANGETAAQLLDRLPAILGDMNPDALATALTRAAFTARLGGEAGLPLQSGDATAPTFAEAQPMPPAVPNIELHVHPVIQLPEQAAPTVQVTNQVQPAPVDVTVHVPEQAPPAVQVTNQVQPAAVTVIDNHPTRAEQTVERDANDEIVKTITTYTKD